MQGDGTFMFTTDDSLKAVYSTELEAFLEQIGCAEAFRHSQLHCRYCNDVITEKNLYAFIPGQQSVEICCNRPGCIITLAEEASK